MALLFDILKAIQDHRAQTQTNQLKSMDATVGTGETVNTNPLTNPPPPDPMQPDPNQMVVQSPLEQQQQSATKRLLTDPKAAYQNSLLGKSVGSIGDWIKGLRGI